MANRITLDGDKLIVALNAAETKIAEKTLPLLAPLLEIQVRLNIKFVLQWVIMGKEAFMGYMERIQEGETPYEVTLEMVEGLNINSQSIDDIELPSLEEIAKLLEWE